MPQNQVQIPKYFYYSPSTYIIRIEHPKGYFGTQAFSGMLMQLFINKGLRGFLPDAFQEDAVGMTFSISENGNDFTLFPIHTQAMNVGELVVDCEGFLSVNPSFELDAGVTFKSAVPNWYLGSSTHTGVGTHGSGHDPRPVPTNELPGLKFVFNAEFEAKEASLNEECNTVDVYILDTIPPKDRIQDKWNTLGATTLAPFQPVLEGVGGVVPFVAPPWVDSYKTSKANYYYPDPVTFQDTAIIENGNPHALIRRNWFKDGPNDNPNNHDNFDVSDHGLFITGIINSIAPAAQINVIQVFNDLGIGTFLSIAAGFQLLSKIRNSRNAQNKAIINCSFTLAYPLPTVNSIQAAIGIKATEELFHSVVSSIGGDAKIIAASGNDSRRPGNIEQARHLASTDLAIGVGALKKDLATPADYSNTADIPQSQGFMVFGGDYDETAGAPVNTGDGVIGIFTGSLNINDLALTDAEGFQGKWDPNHPWIQLPNPGVPTLNDNGYAEWAGTSFATPILAATLARICCAQNNSIDDAVRILKGYDHTNPNECAPWIVNIIWQEHGPGGAAAS